MRRLVLPEQQPEQTAERGGGDYGFGDEFDGGAELFHGAEGDPWLRGIQGRMVQSRPRLFTRFAVDPTVRWDQRRAWQGVEVVD